MSLTNKTRLFPDGAARPAPSGAYVLLLLLAMSCLFGPFSSLVNAFVAKQIWGWYVFDFARGPTLRQWFGIMLIVELPFIGIVAVAARRAQHEKQEVSLGRAIEGHLLIISLALLVLFGAWVVHRFTM